MARIAPRQVTTRDGAPVLIRVTELTDAPALIALDEHVVRTSNFNTTEPGERAQTEDKQRKWIQDRLDHPGCLALVAVAPPNDTGQIIGGLGFKCMEPSRMRHHGHFGIGLHADWHGRGLGRCMVQALIDWARAHEFIERLDLGVFAENTHARALYTSLGFVDVCTLPREFRTADGEYMDDVRMSLWIKKPSASPAERAH